MFIITLISAASLGLVVRNQHPSSAVSKAGSFTIAAAKTVALTSHAIAAAEKKTTGIAVGKDKKSIVVTGATARFVVRTGPKDDMLSYRIKGLRNPTIEAKAGSKLIILFVNSDDDMLHNLRFTMQAPPFEAKMGNRGSVGSGDLHPKKGASFSGQTLTVVLPSKAGTYSYVCTIAGHAAAGMYGKVVVHSGAHHG